MDIQALRTFVLVAKLGSITAASRNLYIAQSAVSRQIAGLERSVGHRLLERVPSGVVPTERGRAFLVQAEMAVNAFDAALGTGTTRPTDERSLTVGMTVAVGQGFLRAVDTALMSQGPPLELFMRQVPFGTTAAEVAAGRLDVAFAWLPVDPWWELETLTLRREERFVALPVGHRLAGVEEIAFEQLLDEPFLALPEVAGAQRSFWLAEELRNGVPTRIGAVVHGPEESVEALCRGRGIAFLGAMHARQYRREDFVVRRVVGLTPAEFGLVWAQGDPRQSVRRLADACLSASAGSSGSPDDPDPLPV